MPPVSAIVALYAVPTVPPGREVVVIVRELDWTAVVTAMFIVAFADCCGRLESVTVITTDAVPAALCAGVPVIAPVVLLIESPLGRPVALNE